MGNIIRREKKYQGLRESGGSGGGASSSSSGAGPSCAQRPTISQSGSAAVADYWDVNGRQQPVGMLIKITLDLLMREFPYLSHQTLNTALASHRNFLAPTYSFLHRQLAAVGLTAGSAFPNEAQDRSFVIKLPPLPAPLPPLPAPPPPLPAPLPPLPAPLPPLPAPPPPQPAPQPPQPAPPQSLPASELHFLRNRRRPLVRMAYPRLNGHYQNLLRELQAAKDRCHSDAAAASDAARTDSEDAAAAAAPADSEQFECECCFGEFAFESMTQCPVGHLFCRECLNGYMREKVYGSGTAVLDCMADGCSMQFLPSLVRSALDPQVLEKFEERLMEENLRTGLVDDENFVRCPTCQWGAILDPGMNVLSCQNCELETCRRCGRDWNEHFGKKCAELEQTSETQLRRDFEERMTRARLRECHQCRASVYKTDGCNHITCRCRAHFCYICRQPLMQKDPYSHFCNHPKEPRDPGCPNKCGKCLLYTDTKQDEDLAIRELQLEARKRRREEGFDEDKLIGAPSSPKRHKH